MAPPPARVRITPVVEWNAGGDRSGEDAVTVEEPIEIRVGGASVSVTMRTPGDDFELAASSDDATTSLLSTMARRPTGNRARTSWT